MAWLRKINNRWYVYYRQNGKEQPPLAVGKSYSKALEEKNRLEERLSLGTESADKIKVRTLYSEYMNYSQVTREPATINYLTYALKPFLEKYGDKFITEMKITDFSNYKNYLMGKYEINGVNIKLKAMKSMFQYAYAERHWLNYNPTTFVKKEKPVKVGRAFTQDEFKLILKECSSNDFRDLILFSFYTKLREAEIVRLTKENITNYFAHIVRVRKSTKTEKYIPIPTIVRYVVDRVKSGPIFSNWNQDRINHHWTRLRKRLQKKDLVKGNFRFYDIRHTAATWAIVHDKMRIELLSELMGHSSIQVTKDVYGHLSKEYLAEQVENLNYNLTVSLPFESKKNNKES